MIFRHNKNANGGRGILSFLRLPATGSHEPVIPGVLSSEEFERALQIERARSDRTGSPFLVLVFTVHHPDAYYEPPGELIHILVRAVRGRCRISDIPGWFGPEKTKVGLILSATPSQAATSLVQAIEEIFRSRIRSLTLPDRAMPAISCEAFEYPTESQSQSFIRGPQPEPPADSAAKPAGALGAVPETLQASIIGERQTNNGKNNPFAR